MRGRGWFGWRGGWWGYGPGFGLGMAWRRGWGGRGGAVPITSPYRGYGYSPYGVMGPPYTW